MAGERRGHRVSATGKGGQTLIEQFLISRSGPELSNLVSNPSALRSS